MASWPTASRCISRPRTSIGISAARISATTICCWTNRPSRSSRTTDEIAERVRKIGGTTLRSIGQIASCRRIEDNDADYVPPRDMLRELMDDNKKVAARMRKAHKWATSTRTSPPQA